MKQVPDIISTKDLSYLEDMFNWHFNLCKKALAYSELVIDETLATFLKDTSNKHKKICEKILKKLG